jgi:hypothetical protein
VRGAAVIMAMCVLCGWASGQPVDSLHASLTVVTDPPGADVSVDSILVGRSPVEELNLTPGRHTVRVMYPSASEWNPLSLRDTLIIAAGDTVIRRYSLGMYVRIVTVPSGAVVSAGDSALGITPYVLRSQEVQRFAITVRRDGYADTTLSLQQTDQLVRVVLVPRGPSGASSRGQATFLSRENEPAAHWTTYVAAASTIGFGIATAYLKNEANHNYDLYVSTGDPTYHDATNKYDRAAYWTLFLTELSFGVLAYLLLAD